MTEDDAKLFARVKFVEGAVVFAGTINPHTPKRVIPSSCMQVWLADDEGEVGPPLDDAQ